MKSRLAFVYLFSLLSAASVFAQIDPELDGIGIYFDPEATSICQPVGSVIPGEYGPGFMFLTITNPSQMSGVLGWECSLEFSSSIFVLDWGYQGNAINAASPPEFDVDLGAPLPWSPTLVLLDMTIFVLNTDCVYWYIHPLAVPSLPGSPSYAAGDNPGLLVPLRQPTGGEQYPVAGINCDCAGVIANEDASWGQVKSLYR